MIDYIKYYLWDDLLEFLNYLLYISVTMGVLLLFSLKESNWKIVSFHEIIPAIIAGLFIGTLMYLSRNPH